MSDAIVLDSGPLGTLCNPKKHSQTVAIRAWLTGLLTAGRRVIIPEIADYEVRRELLRNASYIAVSIRDGYGTQIEYLPLTASAMRLAAEIWAQVRNTGQQTAHDHALDGDVIIAAQAISLGIPVIIARAIRLISRDTYPPKCGRTSSRDPDAPGQIISPQVLTTHMRRPNRATSKSASEG